MTPGTSRATSSPVDNYSSMMFSHVDERRKAGPFIGSFLLQGIAIALLLLITIATPQVIKHDYLTVELVAPPLVKAAADQNAAPVLTVQRKRTVPAAVAIARRESPLLEVPVVRSPVVASISPAVPIVPRGIALRPAVPVEVVGPRPKVETNVFGGSAEATVRARNSYEVQTGGFGDPQGASLSSGGPRRGVQLAAAGSFDRPAGSGTGNGLGGAHGVRGTVASAGFGDGTVVERSSAKPRAFEGTQFGAAVVAPHEVAPRERSVTRAEVTTTPVAIVSKPSPQYTDEARRLRIEGEVVLNVVFGADGRLRVLDVVRGLGHGLDEAAVRAAELIRFTPAQRSGERVDQPATLRIVFALS